MSPRQKHSKPFRMPDLQPERPLSEEGEDYVNVGRTPTELSTSGTASMVELKNTTVPVTTIWGSLTLIRARRSRMETRRGGLRSEGESWSGEAESTLGLAAV